MRSPQAMRALGRRLALAVPSGAVLGLEGPLGAGKTVLAQGIAEGLGIDARRVTSPSFALCHVHPGPVPLVHIDLYRLAGESEAREAGLLEWMDDPGGALVVVEWFDRLPGGRADVRVRILLAGKRSRRVAIAARTDLGLALRGPVRGGAPTAVRRPAPPRRARGRRSAGGRPRRSG